LFALMRRRNTDSSSVRETRIMILFLRLDEPLIEQLDEYLALATMHGKSAQLHDRTKAGNSRDRLFHVSCCLDMVVALRAPSSVLRMTSIPCSTKGTVASAVS